MQLSRVLGIALGLAGFAPMAAFAGGYKVKPVENGALIHGTVFYGREAPPAMSTAKDLGPGGCRATTPDPDITTVGGRLADVLVYLKKVKAGKPFPASTGKVFTDQRACVFVPHMALVKAGGSVTFRNSDKVLHNVKTVSTKNPPFNVGIKGGSFITKVFSKAHEQVTIECSVHSWMRASVVVMAHPYYSVTDAQGQFTITGVPPGSYKLVVSHGSLKKDCAIGFGSGAAKQQKKGGVKFSVKPGAELVIGAYFGGAKARGAIPVPPHQIAPAAKKVAAKVPAVKKVAAKAPAAKKVAAKAPAVKKVAAKAPAAKKVAAKAPAAKKVAAKAPVPKRAAKLVQPERARSAPKADRLRPAAKATAAPKAVVTKPSEHNNHSVGVKPLREPADVVKLLIAAGISFVICGGLFMGLGLHRG